MFIQFVITMIAVYGIHFFGPLLFAMFSILLPIAGIAGFFIWRKHSKKIKKEKQIEKKTITEFSNVLTQQKTVWERVKKDGRNVYTSRYYNWKIEIWEEKDCQIAYILEGEEVVAKATYYPTYQTIGDIEKDTVFFASHGEEPLSASHRNDNALASIWNLFSDQRFKKQTIDNVDEEVAFQSLWKQVTTENYPSLQKEMKEFQDAYTELYRYEFHMTQSEKELWKHGLFLVHHVHSNMPITHLQTTFQYVTNDLQTLQKKLEKRKQENTNTHAKTANEWHEMRCVVETWNEGDQIAYLTYESLYAKTMRILTLSEEDKEELRKGKEDIYNNIHNPNKAVPLLRREMKYMNKIREIKQIVMLEND